MTHTETAPRPTPNQPLHGAGVGLRDPSQLATAAGAVTVVIGSALAARPERTAGILGLGLGTRAARVLGATDLVVGPALLTGRQRTPWMVARTALNLALAGQYRRAARRGAEHPRVAWTGFAVMSVLTVFDGLVAFGLARTERELPNGTAQPGSGVPDGTERVAGPGGAHPDGGGWAHAPAA